MSKGFNVAVEITETHIKLIQARMNQRGAEISVLKVEELKSYDDESISKALKQILSENKSLSSNVFCVVPRKFAILRTLSLPSQDPVEIRKMVDLQTTKQIPYSKDEVVFDYTVVGKDSSGYSKVVLVIVHQDVISRYLSIFKKAAVELEGIALGSQGICNWYSLSCKKENRGTKESFVLMDIDTSNTDICFYSDGNLISSRAVTFGSRELDKNKLDDFLRQVHLTIAAYKKEKNSQPVSQVKLFSNSESIKDIARRLEEELSMSVEMLEVFTGRIQEKKLTAPAMSKSGDVSFAAILGQVFQASGKQLSFLPFSLTAAKQSRVIRKELITCGLLFVACIAFVILTVFIKLNKDEQRLKYLDDSIAQTTPQAKKLEEAIKRLELVKQRLNPDVSSIDIIYDLYDLLPEGMGINIFNLDEFDNLTLQGISLAMSDVFKFQSLLEKSDNFLNVEVKYASKRRIRDGEITDFRISCQVGKVKK